MYTNVTKILRFVLRACRFDVELIIADNGSTDRTAHIAKRLAVENPVVRHLRLEEKGRGRAVKAAWTCSEAHVLTYMDLDLSSELFVLPALVEIILAGGYDIATGSRLLRPDLTVRGWKRDIISRCYIKLIQLAFHVGFTDAQCGFKAISKNAAKHLLQVVDDDGWFMDTELLLTAEALGYRIYDNPLLWIDDPDSRVNIWQTALHDLKGILRMRRKLRQLGRIPPTRTIRQLLGVKRLEQFVEASPVDLTDHTKQTHQKSGLLHSPEKLPRLGDLC